MKSLIIVLSMFILFGCASYTVIKTIPDGVKIKQSNALRGVTPYEYWDRNVSYTSKTFTLQMAGYKDKEITITKDTLCISRLIWIPVLAWPWMFGYQDMYYFELEKSEQPSQGVGSDQIK
jgi:hypothetical protein